MSGIDSVNPQRIHGTVTSIGDMARKTPGMAFAAPAEQVEELRQHEQQRAAREAAGRRHAEDHPDQIYAQVVAGGKVVATVYGSGTAVFEQDIPGLALTANGEGLALADARLADILKASPGTVTYTDFKAPGTVSAGLPESARPQVTARGLNEMVRDMDWSLARARMAGGDTPAS